LRRTRGAMYFESTFLAKGAVLGALGAEETVRKGRLGGRNRIFVDDPEGLRQASSLHLPLRDTPVAYESVKARKVS